MATPSQILTKRKAMDKDDKNPNDKDDKAPKKNALIDFIAKHKKPSNK